MAPMSFRSPAQLVSPLVVMVLSYGGLLDYGLFGSVQLGNRRHHRFIVGEIEALKLHAMGNTQQSGAVKNLREDVDGDKAQREHDDGSDEVAPWGDIGIALEG